MKLYPTFKNLLLICLLWFVALPVAGQGPARSDQPNIILLVGDDHGYPYFGFMGAEYVYTPNMDLLASEGTVFTNGHVTANHCRPSLQTLMTGLFPAQYKSRTEAFRKKSQKDNQDYKAMSVEEQAKWDKNFDHHTMPFFNTLPKMLAEEGYVSFQGGKWWEYNFQSAGFTEGMSKGWDENMPRSEKWFREFMGGDGLDLGRKTNQPVFDFIDKHLNDPFFIWYAPDLPHVPHNAPFPYSKFYRNKPYSESAKKYFAACTWFDANVGALVDYVESKGILDNTIFIYVNDNGWEQGPMDEYTGNKIRNSNGGDKGKLSMYDMSFRTPIVFYGPGGHVPPGVVREELISTVDLVPTVLDYLDMSIPDDLPGYSFKAVVDGTDPPPRTEIYGSVDKLRDQKICDGP